METIREVEDYAGESSGWALDETQALFDHSEFQDGDRTADSLTRYTVVYQYNEAPMAINREHRQEPLEIVNRALDAVVAHIYHRSEVAPEDLPVLVS